MDSCCSFSFLISFQSDHELLHPTVNRCSNSLRARARRTPYYIRRKKKHWRWLQTILWRRRARRWAWPRKRRGRRALDWEEEWYDSCEYHVLLRMRIQKRVFPNQTICWSASSKHPSVGSRISANQRARVGGKGCTDRPDGFPSSRLCRRIDLRSSWAAGPRSSQSHPGEQMDVCYRRLFPL